MAWEEDILFFRTTVIQSHPLMRDTEVFMELSQRFRGISHGKSFFDEDLKEQFIVHIDKLIEQIPYLNDLEIQVGLSRAIALLGDSHSYIIFSALESGVSIPFSFWLLCDGWYVRRAYRDFESMLFSRLDAIDGVAIDEIHELMRPIIPHENGVFLRNDNALLIPYRNFLIYLGIIEKDSMTVSLTFTNIEDYTFTIDVPFVDWLEVVEAGKTVEFVLNTDKFISLSREDENWWLEYFPDESLMYVRFRRFGDSLASMAFWNELLTDKLQESSGVDKFVLDLRGNGGGADLWGFNSFLMWAENEANRNLLGTVFIAVDRVTYSRGVLSAVKMQNVVEDAIIIGQPTALPPNFFANPTNRSLPNTNAGFRVSTNYFLSWPDYEYDALMPDIYIPHTIHDQINSRDAVLEFIKAYQTQR